MSIARFMSTDSQGNVSILKDHYDWRDTWEHIVPVDVLGTRTRLLLYDRFNGDAKLLNTDGAGGISEIATHTGWKKSWDIIVPGEFGAGGRDDVLLYRRDAGEAKFFRSRTNGDLELLKTHDDWRTVWDIIVAGQFADGGHSDLLLYEQDTGTARFFTTDGSGNLTSLKDHTWETGWDIILPGRFGAADAVTDLFFYRRADGSGMFFRSDGAGNIQLIRKYQLGPGWDIIVPGNFGGSGTTDLLFYRRSDGRAAFYTTDSSGGLNLLKEHTWSTIWDVIVPGRFDSSSYTALLLYAGGLNGAAAFGWRGCIDTDVRFSEFFGADHTVMAHFMPQYPIGYAGPIWAENGSGAYFVGQGNFNFGDGAVAHLRFEVGGQRRMVPFSNTPGIWRHVAAVRKANKFTLYVLGTEVESLTISPTDSKLPSLDSTLRLGRCTDNRLVDPEEHAPEGRESQYYGFVDDVAVFTRALTPEEIKQVASHRRIDGLEQGLLAGWTFDASKAQPNGSGRAPLPAKLKRPLVFRSLAGAAGRAVNRVILSPLRDIAYDNDLLPPAPARFTFPLPFNKGEVWRVVQGWGSAQGTHRGSAAFSLDLQSVACTGTCGEPVRSVGPGTVREVVDDDDGDGNYIIVQHHLAVLAAYLHNEKGSSRVNVGDTVTAGQHIANIGIVERHLHFTVRSHLTIPDRRPVTIPYAFQPFDVCTPGHDGTCSEWVHVKHGVPLNNQRIRW